MILSNQAKCLKCGDEPYSAYTHDFKCCKCYNLFVDGGIDYIRQGARDEGKYMSLNITLDDLPCEMMMSAVEWAEENGRNSLGTICAITIALRDCGYEIKEIK